MISSNSQDVIRKAKQIFEQRRAEFESRHANRYISIEPESGDVFIADTFDEAVRAARSTHPERLSHTIRVGHAAALHIGLMEQ